MAILEVNRLLAAGAVETIVLDTAPTGHTLRLLELPDFLDNLLAVFSTFQAKHQEMSRALTGQYRSDEADAFLADLEGKLQGGRARLTDPSSTAAWLVMLAEQLSLDETGRFCEQLQRRQVPIGGILINQVLMDGEEGSGLYQARQRQQRRILQALAQQLSGYPLWISPFQLQEPIGGKALDQVSAALSPVQEGAILDLDSSLEPDPVAPDRSRFSASPKLPDLIEAGIKLAMTGGKGGVGKTTIAGALAWNLAKAHPQHPILVVSIDPAHSLGDLFEVQLGQSPTSLLPNLLGQEIDAETVLEQFRKDYLEDVVAILAGESADVEVQYDPEAWRRLLEMPPPGLDEVMALLAVLDQMEAGEADLVIIDTAPTGHMLRFLQMPEALEGWVSLALKLWVKYRDVVGRPELAQRLRSLLKRVRDLRQDLKDPSFVTFIPVLNPEQAVLAETRRLLQELDQLQIPHPYTVLNRVWCDPSDSFGQVVSQRHQEILAQMAAQPELAAVIPIPFIADPTLERVGAYLLASKS